MRVSTHTDLYILTHAYTHLYTHIHASGAAGIGWLRLVG